MFGLSLFDAAVLAVLAGYLLWLLAPSLWGRVKSWVPFLKPANGSRQIREVWELYLEVRSKLMAMTMDGSVRALDQDFLEDLVQFQKVQRRATPDGGGTSDAVSSQGA